MKIDRVKFLGLCASLAPVLVVACGGGGDDTAGGGSALSAPGASPSAGASSSQPGAAKPGTATTATTATTAGDAVTVNTKPITTKTDACTADIKAPTVSIPTNKAAETAINTILAPLQANPCDEEGATDAQQSFEVTANAKGLLSIRVTGDSFFSGAAHPNGFVQTFNFDVTHGGTRLQLSDVLTEAGLVKELAKCVAAVPNPDGDPGAPADEGAQLDCTTSLTPQPDIQFVPQWVATNEGLEVEADVAHALGDVVSATVAWKDLVTDGLKATVVLDFGKAQP